MRRLINPLFFVLLCLFMYGEVPKPSHAQDDSAPQRLQLIAYEDGPLRAFATDGDMVYLVQANTLLKLSVDSSGQVAEPLAQRTLDAPIIQDMLVFEDNLYVLTGRYLSVIDTQSLQERQRIGGGGEMLHRYAVQLLQVSRQAGLRFFRINSDGSLQPSGQLAVPAAAINAVMLDSNMIAVSEEGAGIQLFTTEDQMMSAIVFESLRLQAFGDYLLAMDSERLRVIDVRDPSQAETVGLYAPLHDVNMAQVAGDYWVLADRMDGLKVYDADFNFRTSQYNQAAQTVAFSPNGRWLVGGHDDAVVIYDARQLPRLEEVARIAVWDRPRRITFAANGDAYVALGDGGVAIIDPDEAELVAPLPFSGPVQHVRFHPQERQIAYVLLGDGRLLTLNFDLQNPQQVEVMADFDVPGQVYNLALDEDTLVVAAGSAGMMLFDLENPSRPRFMTSVAASDAVYQVEYGDGQFLSLDGDALNTWRRNGDSMQATLSPLGVPDSAWLAMGQDMVMLGGAQFAHRYQAVTTAWQKIGEYWAEDAFTSMVLLDNVLAIAGQDGTLSLLSLADPTLPREIAHWQLGAPISAMAYQRGKLFLLDASSRLLVIDIGTEVPNVSSEIDARVLYQSSAPRQQISEFTFDLSAFEIENPSMIPIAALEVDGISWFATETGALWKITDEDVAPRLVSDDFDRVLRHIAVLDAETLLLSMGEGGLLWFDTLNESPIEMLPQTAFASALSPDGDLIAVATGACGLAIYEAASKTLVALAQDGIVSDVRWTPDEGLVALLDGYVVHYRYIPQAPMSPQHPISIDLRLNTGVLQWTRSGHGCIPLEYEVYFNDDLLGKTTQNTWPLSQGQAPAHWQVVAVDVFGNRHSSPTLWIDGNEAGWLAAAQHYQSVTLRQSLSSGMPPLWAIGLALLMAAFAILVMGLRLLKHFQ